MMPAGQITVSPPSNKWSPPRAAFLLAALLAVPSAVLAAPAGNGLPTEHGSAGAALDPTKAMMWKYVAACALRPDQSLSNPKDPKDGPFPGRLGLAPEWLESTCDEACRQKVSACLLALTNRTGKHVQLSLLSASPRMSAALRPGDTDRAFPFQEGVFFGDIFRGQGYVCHGRDDRKGPQVKRFCAAEPASCNGLFTFTDVGPCQDACTLTCGRLPDGTERCPAAQCRSPDGKTWDYPLTPYLRNAIEAGNADQLTGGKSDERQALILSAPATAVYQNIDFGPAAAAHHTLIVAGTTGAPLAIEVFTKGKRLGAGTLLPRKSAAKLTLDTAALTGAHPLELHLKATGPATLTTIELR
jgi:hypothetical protein